MPIIILTNFGESSMISLERPDAYKTFLPHLLKSSRFPQRKMTVGEFVGTLAEKTYLTEETLFFSFSVPDTVAFQAGQYVMITMTRDGLKRVKPYSILNPPSAKGKIDLCVALVLGGFASEIFRALTVGESFTFRGPLGHFLFQEAEQEHWFICVGTGLTPLHSMIQEFVPQYPQKKFVLVFGDKTRPDLLFYDELTEWQKKHTNFTYLPVLSREKWKGKTGYVQQHLPANIQRKIFYICGLKEMVLETQKLLLEKGVDPQKIRMERYT